MENINYSKYKNLFIKYVRSIKYANKYNRKHFCQRHENIFSYTKTVIVPYCVNNFGTSHESFGKNKQHSTTQNKLASTCFKTTTMNDGSTVAQQYG